MKHILFYTHNIFTPENPKGYRIQQYFPYLEEKGYKIELLTTKASFANVLKHAGRADVVYLQRLLLNSLKFHMLRRRAKKIVYDFDDAVMYGSRGESRTRRSRFSRIVGGVDAVFCGNRFLMDEALRHRDDNVFYVPTVVDTDEYPVKSHKDRLPFILGWIGSSSTLRYLNDIKELLVSLSSNEQINFKVVADKPSEITGKGILFEKWQKDKEKASLLSFDMGIMPASDDIWSRGKCGLKLIQYMAAGLPSVTHPVGVATEIVQDGVNGFLRRDIDGWREAIYEMVLNNDLRGKIGRTARDYVEERYSLHRWGPKVCRIIDNL